MLERSIDVLRLLITPYMLFLFFICSLILFSLYKSIPGKKYPVELNICKFASFAYIGFSIVLFVASLFL
jgi:hypothetical protein